MKVLVTGGSTRCMIDQVRCLTNIFRGKTGEYIARDFQENGHDVTLLTSTIPINPYKNLTVHQFRTYEDLKEEMRSLITTGDFDVIIHSAAVSDYKVVGTYTSGQDGLQEIDSSTKISSEYGELYLKLSQTEKLVDLIRLEWGFKGRLVKFKLQVGLSDLELLEIARGSRLHSSADLIVANCLEWSADYAYILGDNIEEKISRSELPVALQRALESL